MQEAAPSPKQRSRGHVRLRNYFLTGLVISAPIGITVYLTWAFVAWVDGRVKPLIPAPYNPDSYLPFSVPGVGLLFAIFVITLLGFLTANILGSTIIGYERSVALLEAPEKQDHGFLSDLLNSVGLRGFECAR